MVICIDTNVKYNYYGNVVTLNKASPEWFNYDCPAIYADDGTLIVKSTLDGFVWDEWETLKTKKEIASFVKQSYIAFCKKYGYDINPNWYKNDALFKI